MEAMGSETAGTAGEPHKLRVGVGAFRPWFLGGNFLC